ncbi:uncharacterized protein EAF02_007305 [Botrytis sinoallii]|uniref:uncharacterized protein n=1 Tax=Botrytis sinoallii TaxID=1463999 RepID=UPI0019026DBB|nr:uncharacterized protein EAF02_007305 [Botrytis sinoallii]KAF7880459.1 hypothetical protein EAF02_007305 [Botrytis sinoallii]
MTQALSLDNLLADFEAENFEKEPLSSVPPTLRGYNMIWKLWEDYLARLNDVNVKPTLRVLKGFFTMLAKERSGLLGKRLSIKTLIQYTIRFKSVYERKHNEELESMQELRTFIKTSLAKSLGLSTKTRPKPIASLNDLQDILGYLWMNDPLNFLYERARVQIALLILILVYTASRPGAVIESHAYYMTGQSMRYKDIKFTLQQSPDGGRPLMSILFTFNLRKNERDDEGEVYKQQLFEDLASRDMCPITLFLALAFADDAFETVKNIEELYDPSICSAKYIDVKFKESVLNKPLFRSNRSMEPTLDAESLTYQAFNHSLRKVAQRAGFKDIFTSYVIRRTSANVLNQHVTSAERGKILGHSNDKVFQNSYLASHSGIDLQSLTVGQDQRTQQINFARSLNSNRGTPLGLITKEFVEIVAKDPEITAAKKRIEDARIEGCEMKIKNEVKRLCNTRREVVKKHAPEMHFEQIMGTRFMPTLRTSIIGMLYGKEDDLPHRSDLVRSLQELCQSMGKDVSNYRCQNPSCRRSSVPFRCQWELFRHNEKGCQRSSMPNDLKFSMTAASSPTLDFQNFLFQDPLFNVAGISNMSPNLDFQEFLLPDPVTGDFLSMVDFPDVLLLEDPPNTTEKFSSNTENNLSSITKKSSSTTSLLCPQTTCPRHIKPLASKRTLKAHMSTHTRINRDHLLCARHDCRWHRNICPFKTQTGFDAHMKYHEKEDRKSVEESPAEILSVCDDEIMGSV